MGRGGGPSPSELCPAETPRLRVPSFQSTPSSRLGSCSRVTGNPSPPPRRFHVCGHLLSSAWRGSCLFGPNSEQYSLQVPSHLDTPGPQSCCCWSAGVQMPTLHPRPQPHGGGPHHVTSASEPAVLPLTPSMDSLLAPLGSGTHMACAPLLCLASELLCFQDQWSAYSRIGPNAKHRPGVQTDRELILQTRLPDHPQGRGDQLWEAG